MNLSIFRKIFMKKYCVNCKEIHTLHKIISKMNLENEKLNKEIQVYNTIKSFNEKSENIFKIIKHQSYTFLITYKEKLNFYGILEEFAFNGYILEKYNVNTRSIISINCDTHYDKKHKYLKDIFIYDFIADEKYQNMGFGSILMKELIKYAKQLNIEHIYGKLSAVDIGNDNNNDDRNKLKNKERLYHFYPKHGFTITSDKKINLNLKQSLKQD